MTGKTERETVVAARAWLARRRAAGAAVVYRVAGEEIPAPGIATAGNEQAGNAPAARKETRNANAPAGNAACIRRRTAPAQAGLFGGAPAASPAEGDDMDLGELEAAVAACAKCALRETRTKTVFGKGNAARRIVFIGEAPGRDEDLSGEPFVGRAGQLLTKILASVGFDRDDVYITNILKCRPPNNRDPLEGEVEACEAWLRRQLELIDPVLIVALGRVAGQNLLKRNASLKVLRGGVHYYDDIRVLVTYHPAALLRNPNLKRAAWEDIQLVRKLYDEEMAG